MSATAAAAACARRGRETMQFLVSPSGLIQELAIAATLVGEQRLENAGVCRLQRRRRFGMPHAVQQTSACFIGGAQIHQPAERAAQVRTDAAVHAVTAWLRQPHDCRPA